MVPRKQSPLAIKTTEAHLCSISMRLEILSKLLFFKNLSKPEHEWVNSFFIEKDYDTGEIICLSGDPAEKLFIIADGRVRLLRHSLAGKEILLDMLTPGEFFGALTGLGNDQYPETAQAHTPCCILVIGRDDFQQILNRIPSVTLSLIEIMANRLNAANQRVHLISALDVEARIASILLMLANKFGDNKGTELLLQVPLYREDLAGMAGATPESTSRVMSRFQKEGLIRSGRGWVSILHPQGLKDIVGSDLEI